MNGPPPSGDGRLLPFLQWGRTQGPQGFDKITYFMCEFGGFCGRNPATPKPLLFQATEIQKLPKKANSRVGGVITVQVMAVTKVSPADEDAVHPVLKGAQDVVRRYARRAHHPDDPDITRVLQTTDPSQVSSGIRSPRAQKAQDGRFKGLIGLSLHVFLSPHGKRWFTGPDRAL